LEEEEVDGGGGGGGAGSDGGGGEGGGGEGLLHGLSQAEHIVHSIWYFDPAHKFDDATVGSFVDAKIMQSVRKLEKNILWVFLIFLM